MEQSITDSILGFRKSWNTCLALSEDRLRMNEDCSELEMLDSFGVEWGNFYLKWSWTGYHVSCLTFRVGNKAIYLISSI